MKEGALSFANFVNLVNLGLVSVVIFCTDSYNVCVCVCMCVFECVGVCELVFECVGIIIIRRIRRTVLL